MTKQQYNQIIAYWKTQEKQSALKIKEANNDYIRDNAPYPLGAKVRVDDSGKELKLIIESYDIDKNGILKPVFVTLEGKCQFVHKPVIIDLL